MLTDKEIFDALRERKGVALTQSDVDAINAIIHTTKTVVGATWDREKLEAELTLDEGKRLKAYRDSVGKWSIGIGRNLDDVGTVPLTRSKADVLANGITEAECDVLFDHDIARSVADLDRRLPWWRSLDSVRQRVLINMCFNMGVIGLCGFVNTLGMIQRKEYNRAGDAMLQSKWARQVGIRAQRLAGMMKNGRT